MSALVSDHVRFVMDQRGLQVRDLASIAGISKAKAQARLDGDSTWYVNEVERIASATDRRLSWFLEQDNI